MNKYSNGAIRKAKVTRKAGNGRNATTWVWQGVVTITDGSGKRSHRQKNLKDGDGNPIEADPDAKRERGHRAAPSGKGAVTAKKALDEWIANLRASELADEQEEAKKKERASRLTVWQCVDQYIRSSYEGGYIEASTVKDYRKCEGRIHTTLDDLPLDELTPAGLNDWQKKLGVAYAHSTVKKTRNVLRVAIQEAMDNGQTTLARNPVVTKRMTIGQKRRARETAPKLNALDKANRSILLEELDHMGDTPVTIAARIALYAGLREAECSALLWCDVDLKEGFISVNKAIGQAKGGIYVKPQKNDGKPREIPINPELATVLRRWKAHQNEVSISLGVDPSKTFVIGNPAIVPPAQCFEYLEGTDRTADDPQQAAKLIGNPDARPDGVYHPAALSREWRTISRASKARGMLGKPVSFHNLRHSFGFYCAGEGGVKIEKLAEWMGHASTQTTEKYYVAKDTKASRESSKQAMRELAEKSVVRDSPAEIVRLKNGTEDAER